MNTSKKSMYNYISFLLIGCIIIFFLGDIFRKISILNQNSFIRQSTISKVIGLVLIVGFFLTYIRYYIKIKNNIKIILGVFILIISYFIGQFALGYNLDSPNFIKNIEYLVKFLYFPIVIIVFYPLKDSSHHINKVIQVIEITFFINLTFMVLGAVFEIDVLRTYMGSRDGYMGIYNRTGQASYFFIIFILYYYYRTITKPIKAVGWKNIDLIKLVIVIFCSILIGTKRIYVFLFLLFVYYFFSQKAYKNLVIYKIIALVSILLFILKNTVLSYLDNTITIFKNIYNDKGFLSSLTSYRSDMLLSLANDYIGEYWTWINYFVGGPSFQDYKYVSGTDVIDLYLFFGFVGFFIYFMFFKSIINFKINTSFFRFYFISIAFLSSVSGAFLYDPWVNLLLIIMVCYFSNNESA